MIKHGLLSLKFSDQQHVSLVHIIQCSLVHFVVQVYELSPLTSVILRMRLYLYATVSL